MLCVVYTATVAELRSCDRSRGSKTLHVFTLCCLLRKCLPTSGLDNDGPVGCQACYAGGWWARTVEGNEVLKLGDAFKSGVHLKERPGGGDESHEK